MDLRLLRYFVAICAAGSVHGAAELVHVAQPSLSRQLQRLERDLGFELFERSSRGLVLTAAGRAFRPVAEDLLGRARQAGATARAIAQGTVSDLTVVAAPTTVADLVAPFIVRCGTAGVVGNVVEALPEAVYGVVARGDADVAIGTRIPPAELRSVVIGHAYLWAQVPAEHPLARREAVPIGELAAEPLIVMSRSHGVRQMLDAAASRAGLSFTAAVETESPSAAQALAAAGRGVCVLSDDSRYDLVSLPIATATGEIIITLYGVWDALHHAEARIEQYLHEFAAYSAEVYPQTVQFADSALAARSVRAPS